MKEKTIEVRTYLNNWKWNSSLIRNASYYTMSNLSEHFHPARFSQQPLAAHKQLRPWRRNRSLNRRREHRAEENSIWDSDPWRRLWDRWRVRRPRRCDSFRAWPRTRVFPAIKTALTLSWFMAVADYNGLGKTNHCYVPLTPILLN